MTQKYKHYHILLYLGFIRPTKKALETKKELKFVSNTHKLYSQSAETRKLIRLNVCTRFTHKITIESYETTTLGARNAGFTSAGEKFARERINIRLNPDLWR